MCYYYAQLNSDNICVGISELSGEVDAENMIRLDNYNVDLLGKRYVGDSRWEQVISIDTTNHVAEQDIALAEFMVSQYEESQKLQEEIQALKNLIIGGNADA